MWRISESAPLGEWVEESSPAAPRQLKLEPAYAQIGTWETSSYGLLSQPEIRGFADTIPFDPAD
jgi:hypothetical protein